MDTRFIITFFVANNHFIFTSESQAIFSIQKAARYPIKTMYISLYIYIYNE